MVLRIITEIIQMQHKLQTEQLQQRKNVISTKKVDGPATFYPIIWSNTFKANLQIKYLSTASRTYVMEPSNKVKSKCIVNG